ncbi:MAG: S41 family peptidase [Bacteroidota bacterium]
MKTKFWQAILLLIVSLTAACSNDDEPQRISSVAEEFLNEILDIMEENSINRNTIDWSSFREEVFEVAADAQTKEDTYAAIRRALALLNDNHSFYIKDDGGSIFAGTIRCNGREGSKPTNLPDSIGYVRVTSFSGPSSSSKALVFAQKIQDQIIAEDKPELVGWVVDLRGNGGGNMWPMLAGIGPVLGEGVSGHFIGPDGGEDSWGYSNGASVANGSSVTQLPDPYKLISPNPKVAVLLNNGIASSGEAIAISFVGRENTRSFGTATCGLSTSNVQYTLSDNTTLLLTTAYMADRDKNTYGVPIEPDVEVADSEMVETALLWLTE